MVREILHRALRSGAITPLEYLRANVQLSHLLSKGGRRAVEGEERNFKRGRFRKTGGKWVYVGKHHLGGEGYEVSTPVAPSATYELVRRREREIVAATEQKFEACSIVLEGEEIYKADGGQHQIELVNLPFVYGAVFTHNHPSSRCFSPQDLDVCVRHRMSEMRAIAPKSILGPVVWVFKNYGLNRTDWDQLEAAYHRIDGEVKVEFSAKIERESDALRQELLIGDCNLRHHYELMLRLEAYFKNSSSERERAVGKKFKFTHEKYEQG